MLLKLSVWLIDYRGGISPMNVNSGMRWEMKHCFGFALLYYF